MKLHAGITSIASVGINEGSTMRTEILGVGGLATGAAIIFAAIGAHAVTSSRDQNTVRDVTGQDEVVRYVCSLSMGQEGTESVSGIDGGVSVLVKDQAYWLFGDTFLSRDPGFVAATYAVSKDFEAADCLRLSFAFADGVPAPLVPPRDDETTVWPESALSDGTSALVWLASVVRDSPMVWHVASIELARIDGGSGQAERIALLWGEDSGVLGVRSPQRVGTSIYMFLYTVRDQIILARVDAPRVGQLDAYQYWNGQNFTSDIGSAVSIWVVRDAEYPSHNGISVLYLQHAQRWAAIYARDLRRVELRTAEDLQGPWSEPLHILDCDRFFADQWPVCYTPEFHAELTTGDGKVFFTLNSGSPYDVHLFELVIEHLRR